MQHSQLGLSAPIRLGRTAATIPTLIPVAAVALNGRYVIRMTGGKLDGVAPVSDRAIVMDVNNAKQLANMLLTCLPASVLHSDEVCAALVTLYDRMIEGPKPEFVG